MLEVIGAASIDELFREIPENLRVKPGSLDLPPALDESLLGRHLHTIAGKNVDMAHTVCFLGAGIYDRFVPSTVGAVLARGEFLTAYTPYQPEVSQGYLQTIYEFQSMIAELFGMDLANASMYDGATAFAESALMAAAISGKDRVAVATSVHPHYRQVLRTYCWSMGIEIVELPHSEGATLDYSAAEGASCILLQHPNFFGTLEDLAKAKEAADRFGALLVVNADPVACALIKPPGAYGADIVTGEGQPLGVAMGLGGPVVGLFSAKAQFVRQIPGRIVGRTKEVDGDRTGYVMTLRTREQDIRREKATSNICTNEALMALANTVHLCSLGKVGMKQVAETTVRNTQYAISKLTEAGAKLAFKGKIFGEFVLRLPKDAVEVRDSLLKEGILAGLPLGGYYEGMDDALLVAVTELRTKAQIDDYAERLKEILRGLRG
ncbi:aminomethyl-transferring glycine dehydrogenase subunit 1 [soil metagenome]